MPPKSNPKKQPTKKTQSKKPTKKTQAKQPAKETRSRSSSSSGDDYPSTPIFSDLPTPIFPNLPIPIIPIIPDLPIYPDPLAQTCIPVYTCGHPHEIFGPIPLSVSHAPSSNYGYPPYYPTGSRLPLTLPHPCYTCHLKFTHELILKIHKRFEPPLTEYNDKIARANQKLWTEFDKYMCDARNNCVAAKESAFMWMNAEVSGAWAGFYSVWGEKK